MPLTNSSAVEIACRDREQNSVYPSLCADDVTQHAERNRAQRALASHRLRRTHRLTIVTLSEFWRTMGVTHPHNVSARCEFFRSCDEAAMHEWMPVICGVVLGVQFQRGRISRSTLLLMIIIAAVAASAASGELALSPLWVFADLALITAGVLIARIPHATRALRRRRQPQRILPSR